MSPALLAVAFSLAASRPATASEPATAPPAPAATPATTSAALPPDCPRGAADPAARMAEGQALIDASMVGEHPVGWDYLWGLQALREAADAGYAPALYAWGRQRFGNLYLDKGPDPDNTAERQAYVVAIAAIGSAARLGDDKARSFFPADVIAGLLDPTGPFPDRSGDELSMTDIPTAWWEEARTIIDHHRRCWP